MDYPYESLSYAARLEFKDAYGVEAWFHCYQRLRVLAPELRTVLHRIWGDGDQLNAYAAPGTHVVRVRREDGRVAVLSALDTAAHAGDIIELHSIRRIHHGFKGDRQFWEYTPFTPTANARVVITFPIGREPEGLTIGATKGTTSPIVSRPGTKEVLLKIHEPAVGSLYRLEWSW